MTEPTTASAPADGKKPRAPRVPRKGVDAALRIAEATTYPEDVREFVRGNSDQRNRLLTASKALVAACERDLGTAKLRLAELESMQHAIEGLGGFALSGITAALDSRIPKES